MLCCLRRRVAPAAPAPIEDDDECPEDLPPLERAPRCLGSCVVCQDDAEVLNLGCGHTYCGGCAQGQLAARWPGQRVTFGYMNCGVCRQPLAHEELEAQLEPHRKLQRACAEVAMRQFSEDGYRQGLFQELGRWAPEDQVRARAEQDMVVHLCDECTEPYCAGRADCAALLEGGGEKTAHLCPRCEWAQQGWDKRRCMVHGLKFAMYKCDSCCDVAIWNCYSNRYCDRCHNQASDAKHYPCPGPELCPLGGMHPPNKPAIHGAGDSMSFVIGCRACLGCVDPEDAEGCNEGNQFGFRAHRWSALRSADAVRRAVGGPELLERFRVRLGLEGGAGVLADDDAVMRLLRAERQEQRRLEAALAAQEQRRLEAAHAERRDMDAAFWEQEVREDPEQIAAVEEAYLESRAERCARHDRESARSTCANRRVRRRRALAAKAARLAASPAAPTRLGARRLGVGEVRRGGRHKLPAVQAPDLEWSLAAPCVPDFQDFAGSRAEASSVTLGDFIAAKLLEL